MNKPKNQQHTLTAQETLAKKLRVQAYVFVALVVLAVLTFFLTSQASKGKESDTERITSVFLVIAVLSLVAFTLWLVEYKQKIPPPPIPPPPPDKPDKDPTILTHIQRHNALIRQAVEPLLEVVESLILKENLYFKLHFSELRDDVVTVTLEGEYKLFNLHSIDQLFDVIVQIDAALENNRPLEGTLSIRDIGGPSVKGYPKRITFLDSPSENGIRRVVKDQFKLEAEATCIVSWKTEPYEISLPYAEFWATAHPLIEMRVDFLYEDTGMNLRGHAECYRSYDDKDSFVHDPSAVYDHFHAFGPFLPYQGMFISVRKKA